MTTDKEQPKAIECRFAVYAKSNEEGDYSDLHLIKEQIHNQDGTITPSTRLVKNYKRNFFITNKAAQNHNDKKEWEHKSNLTEFKSTQRDLANSIARALGKPYLKGSVRDMNESPYVYGTDILSTCLIKQSYKDKWNLFTPYSNAVFDTETDVVYSEDGQIIMATVSFKDKVFTAVQKIFVQGYTDVENRIQMLAKKYIGDTIDARKIIIEVKICNTEMDVIKDCINKAHEWKPDFLSVWNILFDMNKILAACERAGVNPSSFMCDPSIPPQYRNFKFKEGAAKKITASGVTMNFKPAQRWNTVFCPSSFYWIDAMCAYRQVRTGQPDESSYSLDAMLKKNLNITKLKFEEADAYTGLEWHKFMQSNYPLEYIIYNMFDCISMEMLDEKTLDLQLSLPLFAGSTDFSNFNSQPRRAVNELHFFCLNNDRVIGSTSGEMTDDFDEETVKISEWITALPSHLVVDNGLKIVMEDDNIVTNVRIHTGDLDVSAAYPTNECVMNVSKETTSKELIEVEGIDETSKRMQTINFSSGRTNATEFCTNMFGLPTFDQLLDAFKTTA